MPLIEAMSEQLSHGGDLETRWSLPARSSGARLESGLEGYFLERGGSGVPCPGHRFMRIMYIMLNYLWGLITRYPGNEDRRPARPHQAGPGYLYRARQMTSGQRIEGQH